MGQSLTKAVKSGDTALVKQTLAELESKGATKSNTPGSGVNAYELDGRTLLHVASKLGFVDIIPLLVQHGADVNRGDLKKEAPPLLTAARNGQLGCAKALLDAGANANQCDKFKQTALHKACLRGHTEVAALLLDAGATVDARTVLQQTALHWACGRGYVDTVRLLLTKGAAAVINAEDQNGDTALHRAAANGHLSVVQLLCSKEYQANASTCNLADKTPSELAAASNREAIVSFLNIYAPPKEVPRLSVAERKQRHATITFGELQAVQKAGDKREYRHSMGVPATHVEGAGLLDDGVEDEVTDAAL